VTTKRHTQPRPDRSRLRGLVGTAAFLAVPLLLLWWPGCRQYPTVTSVESLKLMKRLYAATNTKNTAWLATVEAGVAQAERDGKLSPPEQQAFAKIIGLARGGDWHAAEQASFRFARDQVGQGFPARPHDDGHAHAPGAAASR
jgi:hypothetical protein